MLRVTFGKSRRNWVHLSNQDPPPRGTNMALISNVFGFWSLAFAGERISSKSLSTLSNLNHQQYRIQVKPKTLEVEEEESI